MRGGYLYNKKVPSLRRVLMSSAKRSAKRSVRRSAKRSAKRLSKTRFKGFFD